MNAIWQSYINGLLVAAGLIMAIGAQNAFVLAQSLRREHHLPVAALCIVCDVLWSASECSGWPHCWRAARCCWRPPAGAAWPFCSGTARWPCAARPDRRACAAKMHSLAPARRAVGSAGGDAAQPTCLSGYRGADRHARRAATGTGLTRSARQRVDLWFLTLAWAVPGWRLGFARPLTWRLIDLGVAAMMFAIAAQLAFAG